MTQEEKAKAYDEAIERANELNYVSDKDSLQRKTVEHIFPQLKESENADEKIRKALIKLVTNHASMDLFIEYDIHLYEALSWLEKQCRNPYSGVSFEYNDNVWGMCARDNGVDILFNKKLIQHISGEKQGKQNPVDKSEPKFHEGDWIVFNGLTLQVKRVVKGFYITTSRDGITNGYGWDIDNAARLWTIAEAKDGDILIDKSNSRECPFIFKETKPSDIKTDVLNPLVVLGHCGIGGAGFTKGSGWGDTVNCTYYPATKEQRDLLFKKMKEKSYKWDAEKKELKKIEHKPAEWHREDEQNLNACLGYIRDEFLRRWLQDIIHTKYDKADWNEEDEKMLNDILMCGEHHCYLDAGNIAWLKSLRHRSQWKPSDEQIYSLDRALHFYGKGTAVYDSVKELLEQLKKLGKE